MGISVITKIISRGLKSKNLFSMKKVGDNLVMLFHNPKSGNSVIKSINPELGHILTYGYKGNRKVLYGNKKLSLFDEIGHDNLKANPQSLALLHTPDKVIHESVHPLLKYKYIASNGKVTEYDDFFGNWIKGNTRNQSVSDYVNGLSFI